jgi:hypothetical protein
MTPQKNDMMLLSLAMTKRNRELTTRLVSYMDERGEDLNRQLCHDADCWSDPKAFYEKELPYRMESAATIDLRHLTEMLARGYTTNLAWLQERLRNMGVNHFDMTLTQYPLSSYGSEQEKLDLINIHRIKLNTRISTLVTAICLSGFGIAAFVGTLLVGTVAEEMLLSRSQKSRERIKALIPDIVEAYKSQMIMHLLESLAHPNSQIINSLNQLPS